MPPSTTWSGSPRARRVVTAVLAAAALLVPTACADGAPAVPPLSVAPAPAAALPGARTAAAPPASCVDTTLAGLDRRARAGQLVMGGVPADGLTGAGRSALEEGAGGVILTDPAGGGEVSSDDAAATVRDARTAAGPGLLVATDQEGGQVQDLAGPGFSSIPAAATQGRDPSGLRADAAGWGRELSEAGVALDLAPVADVVDPDLGEDNAPVGALDRGFGTDPVAVGRAVSAFVGGLDDGGVSATLKHFPGLGQVRENTDFAGAVVDTTTTRDDPSLASFTAGIDAGAGAVMMSSARYTRIDPDAPALFSRTIVTDLLRGDLGYGGVVMTDDVGAAAALKDVPIGRRATRFVGAGGDLVLTVRPSDVAVMIDALVARADGDPAFAARVDESARRVLTLKADRALLRC